MARLSKKLKKETKKGSIMLIDPTGKKGNKTWDNMPTLKRLLKTKKMFI